MFTEIEQRVLAFLRKESAESLLRRADGSINTDAILGLREQWSQAFLLQREWTGSGFFTYFQLPLDLPQVEPSNFIINIAKAEIVGLEAPVEFILWIEKGRWLYLEGFAYGDWNESQQVLRVLKAH